MDRVDREIAKVEQQILKLKKKQVSVWFYCVVHSRNVCLPKEECWTFHIFNFSWCAILNSTTVSEGRFPSLFFTVLNSYSSACEVVSHCGFNFNFLSDQWWTSLYVCVGHLYIFFRELFIQILCPFFLSWVSCYCWIRVLYIFWIFIYMMCKYSLSFCGLFFHYPDSVCWCTELFFPVIHSNSYWASKEI